MDRERTEAAILAARAVAASPGAETLRKHSRGAQGVWTAQDEANLRAGFVMVWNDRTARLERLNVPVKR